MWLPLLVQRLLALQAKSAARTSRQQSIDELFPLLSATRLEERRLLNAAPVVAATHAVIRAPAQARLQTTARDRTIATRTSRTSPRPCTRARLTANSPST